MKNVGFGALLSACVASVGAGNCFSGGVVAVERHRGRTLKRADATKPPRILSPVGPGCRKTTGVVDATALGSTYEAPDSGYLKQQAIAVMMLCEARGKASFDKTTSSRRRELHMIRPLSPADLGKVFSFSDADLAKHGLSLSYSSASVEPGYTLEDVTRLWFGVRADVVTLQQELFEVRAELFRQLDEFISEIEYQRYMLGPDRALEAVLVYFGEQYAELETGYICILNKVAKEFNFGVIAKKCVLQKYTNPIPLSPLMYELAKSLQDVFLQLEHPNCLWCHRSLNVFLGEVVCCDRSLVLTSREDVDEKAAALAVTSGRIKELRANLVEYLKKIQGPE